MSNRSVNSLHDALFRKVLENEESREAVITDNLRTDLRARLVGPGKLLETTQIDRDNMTRTAGDGIVEFRLASGGKSGGKAGGKTGQRALVDFLLEHKSSREPRVMLQILKRKVAIWERHLEGKAAQLEELPLVIFMLFYHGKQCWEVPGGLDIAFGGAGDGGKGRAGAGEKAGANDWLGLKMRGVAVNLADMDPTRLSTDAFAQMAFHSLLYGTGIQTGFKALTDSLTVPPGPQFAKYRQDPALTAPIVSYMLGLGKDDAATIGAALDIAQPDMGGEIMLSAADQFRAEGKAEGKAENLAQFVLGRFGEMPGGVAELMKTATPDQLDTWTVQLSKGEPLEAIFGKAARQ